ncbi:hypothetical protein [Leisingera sp. ANG59]|uniref:hypothetical protein n=1 Tax=Leisingera sp. ANG59 TaxID=2675221 RepID=UPI0020C6968C|nr:hypothetical protein [Leisingera sp. ANG59]
MDGATPNVVTEDGLRDLLSDGYLIEVICNQTAEKRHNSWYGSWVVRGDEEWPGCEDACHKPKRLQIALVQDDRRTRQFPGRHGVPFGEHPADRGTT